MSSNKFKRFYHPRLGYFVYKHKGNGLIVDNIFKPLKSLASSVFKKVAKPMAKKVIESGISHAGDKIGKKAVEKSGNLIMQRLHGSKKKPNNKAIIHKKQNHEDYNTILNRLISGNGIFK